MVKEERDMDALNLLKKDHSKVNSLFSEFEEANDIREKQDLFAQICEELITHSEAEEEILYPALAENQDSEDLVEESYSEHSDVKELLDDLSEIGVDSPEFGMKFQELKNMVQHHVHEEENELFPKANQILGQDRLKEMVEEIEDVKTTVREEMVS